MVMSRIGSKQTHWLFQTIVFLVGCIYSVRAQTDLTQTTAAPTPTTGTVDGNPVNRFTVVTTRDAGAATVYNAESFVVDLFTSSPTCAPNAVTPSCNIGCAPLNAPNTASASCLSTATLPASPDVYYATGTVTDNLDGTYDITYYPEKNGVYDISIMRATAGGLTANYYDNVWFNGVPATTVVDTQINFQWGTGALTTFGVDYVSVRWEGKLLGGFSEAYTIYAYADDGVRVWIDKQLIIDSWEVCCVESWGTVTLSAGYLHDIIVEYQELRGEATMELRWSSPSTFKEVIPTLNLYYLEHISGSPFTAVTINTGIDADPTKTVATGDGLVGGTVALPNPISITAYDVFGNVQDAVTPLYTLGVTGPDGAPVTSITYVAAGVYTASYTVVATGDYTVDIQFSGSSISGLPVVVPITSGVNSAADSTAAGAGLTAAVAGAYTTFDVQVKDANGNNALIESVVDVYSVKGLTTIVAHAEYQGAGLYTISYTATEVGSYTTTILVDGLSLPSTYALTVSPGPAYVPNCEATGAGLTAGVAGVASTFQIQAKDEFGNSLTTGVEVFTVSLSGAATIATTSVYSGANGIHDVSYTPTVSGTYSMHVTLGGVYISGGVYTVDVSTGAVSAALSTASGTGIATGQVGAESSFTVQVKDTQGNNAVGGAHTVTGTLTCVAAVPVTFTYVTGTDGQYTGTYTPIEISPCSLVVQVSAAAISGSPFTITVTVGAPDAASVTVLPSPAAGAVAGSSTLTTITSIDAGGNPATTGGQIYNVVYDGTELTVTDVGDGTHTFSLAPTESGSFLTNVYVTNVGGLVGTYYSDMNLVTSVATRTDSSINFDWGYGEAIAATTPADYFSIRWSGRIKVPYTETYTFFIAISTHSATRLYIDSVAIIDEWDVSTGSTEVFGSVTMNANQFYDIIIDFREQQYTAAITASIQSTSILKQVIPSSYLYAKEHAAASPYTTVVVPAVPDASTTTVSDNPPATPTTDLALLSSSVPASLTVGVTYTFTVQARDIYGNLDDGGSSASYTASLVEVNSVTTVAGLAAVDIGGGAFTIDLTPTLVGTNSLLNFYLGGVHIYGSPFTVQVAAGAVDAVSCTSDLVAPATWSVGDTQTFTIQAIDSQGNSLTTGGESFLVAGTGPSTTNGIVTDNGDGTYSVSFTPTVSGTWTITISLGGTTINGGVAYTPITVNPSSALGSACTLVGAVPTPAAGVADSFTVQATDAYGNAHTTSGEEFYVLLTLKSDGSTSRATVTYSGASGQYVMDFTLAAGDYLVSCLLAEAVGSSANGLTGSYFNNRYLSGTAALERVDPVVDFNWGTDLVTATAKDYVSVSWTGYIVAPSNIAFDFFLTFTDGVRLYIDGVLIIDQWDAGVSPATVSHTFATTGMLYPIRLDFKHATGAASVLFEWDIGGGQVTVPTLSLYPVGQHIATSPFDMTVA